MSLAPDVRLDFAGALRHSCAGRPKQWPREKAADGQYHTEAASQFLSPPFCVWPSISISHSHLTRLACEHVSPPHLFFVHRSILPFFFTFKRSQAPSLAASSPRARRRAGQPQPCRTTC